MSLTINHGFASSQPDDPAQPSLIQPSHWNDAHVVQMPGQRLVGRSAAGAGAAEAVSVGGGLSLAGGVLSAVPQLPAPAVATSGTAGRWMVPPVIVAGVTVAVNTLYLSPLPIDAPLTLDRLAVRVTTGTAGNAKLAAYTWDDAAASFVLVPDSEITADLSTASAGFIIGTPTAPIVVSRPLVLWIASVFSAAAPVTGWGATTSSGGGMQRWIGQDEPLANNVLSGTAGFARVARTAALTYSAGTSFITTGAATIDRTGITLSDAAPGSPIGIARRSA